MSLQIMYIQSTILSCIISQIIFRFSIYSIFNQCDLVFPIKKHLFLSIHNSIVMQKVNP